MTETEKEKRIATLKAIEEKIGEYNNADGISAKKLLAWLSKRDGLKYKPEVLPELLRDLFARDLLIFSSQGMRATSERIGAKFIVFCAPSMRDLLRRGGTHAEFGKPFFMPKKHDLRGMPFRALGVFDDAASAYHAAHVNWFDERTSSDSLPHGFMDANTAIALPGNSYSAADAATAGLFRGTTARAVCELERGQYVLRYIVCGMACMRSVRDAEGFGSEKPKDEKGAAKAQERQLTHAERVREAEIDAICKAMRTSIYPEVYDRLKDEADDDVLKLSFSAEVNFASKVASAVMSGSIRMKSKGSAHFDDPAQMQLNLKDDE